MSDIDFEELDKAVNSLVGGDDEKPQAQPSDAPAANNESLSVGDTSKDEPKAPIGNLPTKRAGRFMDMKHDPSSIQNNSSLMNKVETNIAPPVGNDTEAVKKDDDEKPQSSSTDMPDPLDHKPDIIPPKNPNKESEESIVEEETKSGLDFEETESKKDAEETDGDDKKPSPFIEDAKVEKRPLGGFSSESPADLEPESEASTDEEQNETPAETPPEPIELPPELDKDLVAIEAGGSPDSIKSPADTKDEKSEDNDDQKEEISEDQTPSTEAQVDQKDKTKPQDHKERVAELLASASSGSIPDQYKRENRSHELQQDKSHPLFDAEHFKASPASAAKKPKSAAKEIMQWIFISIGLLLLGASLGAAIFVFVNNQ